MMLCVHCNTYRPEGEGPCPYCGGPAPANGANSGGSGFFSAGSGHTTVAMPPLGASFGTGPGPGIGTGTEWQAQSLSSYQPYQQQGLGSLGNGGGSGVNYPSVGSGGSDVSYPALSTPGFSSPGAMSGTDGISAPLWGQNQSLPPGEATEAVSQEPFPAGQQQFPGAYPGFEGMSVQQQTGPQPPLQGQGQQTMAMLPVLYQDPANPSTQSLILIPQVQDQRTNTGALLPFNQQVPGPPIAGIPTEEEALYIPPMYTKPRPIIPRYRAISGFLSFVIVILLLCSAATYYAKVTGKLSFLGQLVGAAPPNVAATPVPNLPDPKASENGPAYGIISSATTAPSVDPKTGIALQPSQVFKPGQTIYLTYSVHAKKAGTVTVKWYTNGLLYQVLSKATPDSKGGSWTGVSMMRFTQPLEGMVELYWNDAGKQPQLAIRLYFVVRP
ncbi:hypothetical protein [Thermogemmatispora carboxidivorans]|uniref:hypothetical protein n=1 Tax=Thermogemmatispora carboxidivorans TaxID=1382306 RepID=UPI000699787D|nr:hypothetical protein [Thermogemmatispora carboxidivorans]